jgi:hypothetical protein
MDFGIAETGIARGSPPGTTTEVLRVGFPSKEIRVVSETNKEPLLSLVISLSWTLGSYTLTNRDRSPCVYQ